MALFAPMFGRGLLVLTNILVLSLLILAAARALRVKELRRRQAEEQLRREIAARERAEEELQQAIQSEREAQQKLKDAQSQFGQSGKNASLVQRVADVAHEINSPLSFVSNNVAMLQREIHGLCQLLSLYAQADPLLSGRDPALGAKIRELGQSIDLAYTQSRIDDVLARSRDELRRIERTIKELQDFASTDERDLHEADLNAGID